ncbi:nuclear transport factor 2 family protein [Zhihengliuella sp.]|uniref:nuclear transport factor 2 family protein n=1 Tax=Zhihengliuella sp. TaxID=1954483 RepID=UPI0028123F71|nr:nuclear transport factor 2 family protein [Zhihengliuella sp.]
MTTTVSEDLAAQRVEIVRKYFRMVDAGDPGLLDLDTDDVEIFFPKFGHGRGREDMSEFARRLWIGLGSIEHDIEGLDIMVSGDRVAVEGRECGTLADGTAWPDGQVSTGRFCNVFAFRGTLISSVHIYADPDIASAHAEKVRQLHRGVVKRRPSASPTETCKARTARP